MSLNLYGDENKIVDHFIRSGLDDVEAKIYTAVLCRQYLAPRAELISVLRYHVPDSRRDPELSEKRIGKAIDHLVELKLFRIVRNKREEIIGAASPWEDAVCAAFPEQGRLEPEIAVIVSDSFKKFADYSPRERMLIERLGWASWEKPRQSFREAITEARHLIRLGVYSSITVYDEIKDQIYNAMVDHREMNVQILMFSPKLAARIENNPDLAKDVEIRTKDWQTLYRRARLEARKNGHTPKMEIRHINDEDMSAFHRVALIDNQKWIMNVHLTGVERGVEGMVYQGSCQEKSPSNIYSLLDFYWHATWKEATPVAPLQRAARWLKDNRHLLVLPILAVAGWMLFTTAGNWLGIKNEWWGGALVGLAISEIYSNGSAILNDLLESVKKIIEALQGSISPRRT